MLSLATLSTAFLAFQLPGVQQISGLSSDFFPQAAIDIATKLHKIMFHDAQILAFGLLVITGGIVAIGSYAEKSFNFQEIVVKVFGAFLLLYTINFTFGWTMQAGGAIASDIMTPKEILAVNVDFAKTADAQEKTTESKVADGIKNLFSGTLGTFISNASKGLVAGGLYALIAVVFFLVIQLTMILWKTLALILYIFAPLCIALGVVPGFGTRILFSWYGAVVQLSAWQIWIAVCAFFVGHAQDLYFSTYLPGSGNFLDPAVQVSAIGVASMFIVLAVLGPLFISKLIPTSDFTAAGAAGITFVTSKVFNTATSAVTSGVKAAAGAA